MVRTQSQNDSRTHTNRSETRCKETVMTISIADKCMLLLGVLLLTTDVDMMKVINHRKRSSLEMGIQKSSLIGLIHGQNEKKIFLLYFS